MVSSTAPLSSMEAWLYHSSKTMPTEASDGPDALEDPGRRPATGRGHVVGSVVGGGQFGHVLALVAAFGNRLAVDGGPAGSRPGS